MPEQKTLERARAAKRAGKAPTTQAGEFVREEIEHVREGKHGARSAKQAIAIGLSKARRAGVALKPPPGNGSKQSPKEAAEKEKKTSTGRTRSEAAKIGARIRLATQPRSARVRAGKRALAGEPTSTTSPTALARQAKSAAAKRSPADRSRSAKQAAETKGPEVRQQAAKEGARTKGGSGRHAAAVKAARTRQKSAQ